MSGYRRIEVTRSIRDFGNRLAKAETVNNRMCFDGVHFGMRVAAPNDEHIHP